MLGSLFPLVAWLFSSTPVDTLEAPNQIVAAAVRAAEGDSAARLIARWDNRLRRDSADRPALLGRASLARLLYDYATAERLYHRLVGRDSASGDQFTAQGLLGLAQARDAQGRSNEAAQGFAAARKAARVAADSAAEGESLLGLSLQRAFTEGIPNGLATLDTVERLVSPSRYDLHAERLRQRGALRGIVGQPGARADALEALALARKSGLNRVVGQSLKSLAQVLQFEGKRDSSILVLKQAEDFYRRGRDRTQLSSALLWHVNALLGQGDLGEANELVQLARIEGQASGNLFAVATAYTASGSIATSLNDYATASSHFDQSIALFRKLGDPSGEMKARDYLSVIALASGDLAGARRQTLEVLQWYRRTQEALIEFSALRNLAIIAMREGDWGEAQRRIQEAHALARRLNRPLWTAELSYDDAKLALSRGELANAERSFARYLSTLDTSQHVFRHDARVRLAEVRARQGDLAGAQREAAAAWDELERWRSTLSDVELRVLTFQASPTEMNDRDASVVRVLGALAAGGRTEDAFQLAERRRARELADRLAQSRALHRGETPISDARPGPRWVDVSRVSGLIPDDSTAILEYVTGSLGAPTTLFLVRRGTDRGVLSFQLPPADSLTDRIDRFEALLQRGDRADALARALGTTLLQPALNAIPSTIRRLVIVPDGPLHGFPFDAVEVGGARVTERFSVSLAPSAAVIGTLWQEKKTGKPAQSVRLLSFGDPALPDAPAARTGIAGDTIRSAGDLGEPLKRLRASAREARLVARYALSAEVRLGKEASAAYLKHTQLTPFRVLHFATHALIDEHTAARSAIALAPGDGETGLVGPAELAALRLNADLVVLSSCRSAGGVVVTGEGVQGLTAPLLQAGARSVVATQWPIGDRSSVRMVESIYRQLAEGLPVGEALRIAKLDAVKRGTPAGEWAAFVVVGDPLVRIPLRAPRRTDWPWIAAGGGLVVLLGLYWARTRKRRIGEAS